ncbi:MAG: TetR/AcrR family transcriptional regulator [Clostridiales bacterium]|nr:TetR/AcrR family transcriptional regulator [Clostridiales bacterium]MCD7844076.1 TetR/AcrR family transcriptional regulator [Clostridiales bacterium]MCD8354496.1 TetR/AcrR family transcriptional regulator [Clostridiales bacterium]
MAKKSNRNTRRKIVSAAWKLFYEQGYDETTVDEIIAASGTSKGSFYHYFSGKDGLLSSLSSLFDDKYEELMEEMDPRMDSFEKLLYLNRELFAFIESSISVELMSRMYATQLTTSGERHLMDQGRVYYKLLRSIAAEGQARGQITAARSPAEVSRIYAMCERALIYDWCIRGGEYSLAAYGREMMPLLLHQLRGEVYR